MIQVTRKDGKESADAMLRRFTRKVQQSGVLATEKNQQFHTKPLSKVERRKSAIARKNYKAKTGKR